ncbi:unnamed protein product [Paramecium primaurelia]|uniref:Transmembrane protein n=1 Tax=Paramecium primaurelia TaxID=5886 RepID=A0A8S1LNU2_PARPR|nr:unnamed protein product [Paramecium primaurelia]
MFIIAYALQLNIYLGKIQDPLILPNQTGMLVDIFYDVIDSFKTRRNEQIDLLYVDQPDQANITFGFLRNYNQEKSIVLTQDAIQLDYLEYDLSKPILTENYIFIYPSLVVTLFSRIVWELFFNYIIIIFPWIMLYANFMIFFLSKQKYRTYSKKIRVSLQILVGNQETNQSTLILKIMFIIITFLISAIIFIDFIYVVGNAIQRQNFNSLNDLAMNQFQLCSVKNDKFVSEMIQRYRDISYQEEENIKQCIDMLFKNENAVIFVSEFQYGLFLKNYPEYTYLKYQLKYNSYRSYQLLFNQTIDYNIRKDINASIDQLWPQKYDLDVRKKYLVQLVYVKSAVVSLIFTNKTFLTTSIMISITSILLIQISIVRKQCRLCRKKLPFPFISHKAKVIRTKETKTNMNDSQIFITGILEELKN